MVNILFLEEGLFQFVYTKNYIILPKFFTYLKKSSFSFL